MKRVAVLLTVILFLGVLFSRPVWGQSGAFELAADNLPSDVNWNWDVALGYTDGDGDLDIVLANQGRERLYLNDGSGVFADAPLTAFPDNDDNSWGVALGDVDSDGDLDAIFANTFQNRLYLNDGSGVFSDVTLTRLPADEDDSRGVALGDVDGDGDLDIVLATRLGRNRLYLNDGSGVFRDAPSGNFPGDGGNTRGVALGDVNGDSALDIVFANKDGQNRLYLNDGAGVYRDVTLAQFPEDYDNSRGIAIGDIDGDRDRDIIFANRRGRNRLYVNDGSGVFDGATAVRLATRSDWSLDVAMGDIDGDRDLDIIFASFDEQNRLYLNDGAGAFEEVTATQLPVDSDGALGVALGDIDGDRDLDIVFATGKKNRLYINLGQPSLFSCPPGCAGYP